VEEANKPTENLSQDGEWRYRCNDSMLFRGQLMIVHQTYSSVAREVGLTRERIRQFANGVYIPSGHVDKICKFVSCKPKQLGLEKVWARRKPKVVKMWIEGGCKRPQVEKLTTEELANFLGYESSTKKSQMIATWITNAGLPVFEKGGYRGLQNIFLWEEVEEWLMSFVPPEGNCE